MSFLGRYKFWWLVPTALIVGAIVLLVFFGDRGGGERLYPQF